MYKHILIAIDGSELAARGLKHGLELARAINAHVTIVTVTEMWPPSQMAYAAKRFKSEPVTPYEQEAIALASGILEDASNTASQFGIKAAVMHIADMTPAEGIQKAAKDSKSDLIVVASHGRRGINRAILGSVAMEVVSRSTIPTLIVR